MQGTQMKRFVRRAAAAALVAGMASLPAVRASGGLRQTFKPAGVPSTVSVTGTELLVGNVVRSRYYRFGEGAPGRKPVVVFVPGSGCDGALALGTDGKAHAGPEMFALSHLNEADVYVLEPPGIPRQFAAPVHGSSEGCPQSFLVANRFEDVMAAYGRAFRDITDGRPTPMPVMVVGTSDGALMAAALAADNTASTHVVLISGFGTPQVTSQLEQRLDDAFSEHVNAKALEGVRQYRDQLEFARMHPQSPVIWQGQPMSRWATSAYISGVDMVRRIPGTVNLLLVQGGRDTQWSPDAFRQGLATLLAAGRGASVRYIPCGDHQLICSGDAPGPGRLKETIEQAMRWMLGGQPDASWVTFDGRRAVSPPPGRRLPVGYAGGTPPR